MPRRKTSVKIKTMGAVDIHFHGAFGIDLMRASPPQLRELTEALGQQGVAAFCPTTLSVPFDELGERVRVLGAWISEFDPSTQTGAVPLGIHLEGPYIHPLACGAHPPETIRPFKFSELETLWEMSRHQLKILTFAPELLSRTELRRLVSWAKLRKITLSVGHSLASEAQAREAFSLGCQGLTHAWNAMKFHHRSPGALGAALGRPGVSVEVILDLIHLSPTLVRWTRKLHAPHPLCFVSDCVPATLTRKGSEHSFGPLKIRWEGGACRTPDGNLAGGGILLPQAFARWVEWEAQDLGLSTPQAYALLRKQIPFLTEMPLRYLALETKIAELKKRRPVEWAILSTEKHVQVKIEPLF